MGNKRKFSFAFCVCGVFGKKKEFVLSIHSCGALVPSLFNVFTFCGPCNILIVIWVSWNPPHGQHLLCSKNQSANDTHTHTHLPLNNIHFRQEMWCDFVSPPHTYMSAHCLLHAPLLMEKMKMTKFGLSRFGFLVFLWFGSVLFRLFRCFFGVMLPLW